MVVGTASFPASVRLLQLRGFPGAGSASLPTRAWPRDDARSFLYSPAVGRDRELPWSCFISVFSHLSSLGGLSVQ